MIRAIKPDVSPARGPRIIKQNRDVVGWDLVEAQTEAGVALIELVRPARSTSRRDPKKWRAVNDSSL